MFHFLALGLLALAAPAASPPTDVRDRVEQQCTVSDTDLVGKRLARACRAAQWRAKPETATARPPRDPQLASAQRP